MVIRDINMVDITTLELVYPIHLELTLQDHIHLDLIHQLEHTHQLQDTFHQHSILQHLDHVLLAHIHLIHLLQDLDIHHSQVMFCL